MIEEKTNICVHLVLIICGIISCFFSHSLHVFIYFKI